MKDNHVNEEPIVTLEPFVPEEELEENLLQENPGATVDFKLIIDNICIRSEMEKWRRTSKYIEEIHKQDSSGTKARGLFKHQWDDIISNIEKFLVSPYTTLLSSDFDSVSDSDDQDILCDAIMTEREKVMLILGHYTDVAGLDYFKRYLYAPLRPIQRIYHGSRVLVKVSLPPIMNNVNGWAIGKKKIARAKSIPPGS
ncbi:unnamed protein product [Rhizophagus irregularis]|uniref:Uncharacterized protein n=1 Tax=Rhizophagus irregularis TaxID=588596 RepID=A0A915ZD91_9GLOM|nr:unnamed protein product [Rhizophagus irregularis]